MWQSSLAVRAKHARGKGANTLHAVPQVSLAGAQSSSWDVGTPRPGAAQVTEVPGISPVSPCCQPCQPSASPKAKVTQLCQP